MPVARYYKTLFLPSLEGQFKIWKNDYSKVAAKVDEAVAMGNIIGISDRMKNNPTKGPNVACLNYLSMWRSTFPNWTQLIGPNEIMALNFPDEWTNMESNRILRSSWFSDDSPLPFLVAGVNKSRLVTHGGLTYGQWVRLGSPKTAEETASALNEEYRGTLFQGECFKTRGRPSMFANPIFADPLREVYPSWILNDEEPPFGQIHGAGGLNTVDGRRALDAPVSPLSHFDATRYTNFGSVVNIQDQLFISVVSDFPADEVLSHVREPWQPYVEKVPVIDVRDELFD